MRSSSNSANQIRYHSNIEITTYITPSTSVVHKWQSDFIIIELCIPVKNSVNVDFGFKCQYGDTTL